MDGNSEAAGDVQVVWIGSVGDTGCLGSAAGGAFVLAALVALSMIGIRRIS